MRGVVEGLRSPVPLITRVPGVLQEDDFLRRFLPAFDDAIAPIISTLDNLAAYLDPELAPDDFVAWLASWVDIEPDGGWTLAQRRQIVAEAVLLHQRAGTVRGIRDAVQLVAGPRSAVEIEESGGAGWSSTPGGEPAGTTPAYVEVRVTGVAKDEDLRRRVERVLDAFVPAHVPWRLVEAGSGRPDHEEGGAS